MSAWGRGRNVVMRISASLRAALVLETALCACVAGCVAPFPGDTPDAAAEFTDGPASSGNPDALGDDGHAQGSLADGSLDALTQSDSGDGAASDGSADASAASDGAVEASRASDGTVDALVASDGSVDALVASDGSVDALVSDARVTLSDASDSDAVGTTLASCATKNGGCDPNATCAVVAGGIACACHAGYSGTGTTCTAVNPCQTNNGGCATGATCTMTGPGANSCACPSGESVCSGACINETNNSTPNATNCGGCGSSYTCTGGQICQGGSCGCSAGTIACTGSCPTSGSSCIQVTAIAAGQWHACAVLSTGAVECWGNNLYAQLGQGPPVPIRHTPSSCPG